MKPDPHARLKHRLRRRLLSMVERRLPARFVQRIWTNPLVDRAWYLETYPDIAATGSDPELHYRLFGIDEGRDPNRFFSTSWYLAENPDVRGRMAPHDHYLVHGGFEGRDPSIRFRTSDYLAFNSDVRRSGMNPLWHYLVAGAAEGREPMPTLDAGTPATWSRLSSFWERTHPLPPTRRAIVNPTASVGVVVHLYYPDLWPEIRTYLDSFSEFRLFVSLARETGDGFDEVILLDYPNAAVRYFENRGRDMGPFVELLAAGAFDGLELVCKIHSKLSPQLVEAAEWRRRLLGDIVGSPSVVSEVRSMFASDPRIGMVGPAQMYFTEAVGDQDANAGHLRNLSARARVPLDFGHVPFFGGSMFWFRPDALEPLRRLGLRQSDFEPEERQVDGALQHALERFLPAVVRTAGYRTVPFEPAQRRAANGTRIGNRTIKLIALYQPQRSSAVDSEGLLGAGPVGWTSVAAARPLFEGHRQPRLPTDLGFHDQRVPDVREAQATLAADHGVHAFAHYFYWINGRRVMDRPLRDSLSSRTPQLPFLICWANESLTGRWNRDHLDVVIEQRYSPEFAKAFIRDVIPIMRDPRYLRLQGSPVLIVTRPAEIPDAKAAVRIWRDEAKRAGIGDLHVAGFRTSTDVDIHALGFDAEVDLPPVGIALASPSRSVVGLSPEFTGRVIAYEDVVAASVHAARPIGGVRHSAVMGPLDATPGQGSAADIATGATAALYKRWLEELVEREVAAGPGESLMFIDSWNDWGRGTNMEPDSVYGRAFLEATSDALVAVADRHRPVQSLPVTRDLAKATGVY